MKKQWHIKKKYFIGNSKVNNLGTEEENVDSIYQTKILNKKM